MRYFYGYPYWPENTRIYISEEEYNSVINNYSFLINVCDIEEHFDILINNYFEYEKCLSGILISSFLAFKFEIIEFQKNEREIIRLINNLLSSCRLFLDHNSKILSKIDEDYYQKYLQKTHSLYDSNVEYRILEYVRNVLQHSGAPISIEFSKTFAKTENDKAEESINILLNIDYLLNNDTNYNQKVKSDLLDLKVSKMRLNDFIRKYIYLLGILLKETRTILKTKYDYSYSVYLQLLTYKVQIKAPPEQELQKIVFLSKEDNEGFIKYDLSDSLIKNLDLLKNRNSLNKDYSGSSMVN